MTAVNRVAELRSRDLRARELSETELRLRIELHTRDSVERLHSVRTDGGRIALPAGDPDREAELRSLYRSASPDQQVALASASYQLASALSAEVARGSDLASASSRLQAPLTQAGEVYALVSGEGSLDRLTTGVMYMAVDGIDQEVYGLATELQGNLDQTKAKREEIADFRDALANWPEGAETQEFTWTETGPDGKMVEKTEQLTREQAEAKLENLEGELGTMRDMKDDWQLQLQQAMEKQAQAMQTLSGIIKTFHETAKSIIQNLRS